MIKDTFVDSVVDVLERGYSSNILVTDELVFDV
jgi:hypothetical protein